MVRASRPGLRSLAVGSAVSAPKSRSPSGVFLSSSDRTTLLRPTAARRPQQLLPEDVCACNSLVQAINGDNIFLPTTAGQHTVQSR